MSDSFGWFESFYRTPPLWKERLMGLTQFQLNKLRFPDAYPEQELQMPHTPYGTVLGKRAERYFSFAVQQSLNYDILLENVQVQGTRRTLGELDFLVWDRENAKAIHIELVYKFYLFTPTIHAIPKPLKTLPVHPWHRLIGPAGRDTFVAKMARLRRQQLPLLFKTETRDILGKLGLGSDQIEQRVCFLGQIFLPDFEARKDLAGINRDCVQGSYLSFSAFAKSETHHDRTISQYYLPHKREWPLSADFKQEQYIEFPKILEEIQRTHRKNHAVMVWKQPPNGDAQKCFVLPDQLYHRLSSD